METLKEIFDTEQFDSPDVADEVFEQPPSKWRNLYRYVISTPVLTNDGSVIYRIGDHMNENQKVYPSFDVAHSVGLEFMRKNKEWADFYQVEYLGPVSI